MVNVIRSSQNAWWAAALTVAALGFGRRVAVRGRALLVLNLNGGAIAHMHPLSANYRRVPSVSPASTPARPKRPCPVRRGKNIGRPSANRHENPRVAPRPNPGSRCARRVSGRNADSTLRGGRE
jgi:hypothetical protein